jgi:hypothetical protein
MDVPDKSPDELTVMPVIRQEEKAQEDDGHEKDRQDPLEHIKSIFLIDS